MFNFINYTLLYLSIGAILGTYLRIVITQQFKHQIESLLFLDLINNFIGSFIMGIYSNALIKNAPQLHIMITTGFCGCLTTWSAWMMQCITELAAFRDFQCMMTVFLGVVSSYSGYKFGQALGDGSKYPIWLVVLQSNTANRIAAVGVVVIYLYFLYTIEHKTSIALSLSPLGAALRWQLSKLNSKIWFPIGTYAANLLAVTLAANLSGIQIDVNSVILAGIIQGFCGSLSTVSTWIKETCSFPDILESLIYSATSISTCMLFGVIIYEQYVS